MKVLAPLVGSVVVTFGRELPKVGGFLLILLFPPQKTNIDHHYITEILFKLEEIAKNTLTY
jgi:hypothetical protein